MSIKLYELPQRREGGIKIYCECSDGSGFITFYHVDGMYSYCVSEKGNTTHLHCCTELVEHEDGYKFKD